MSEDVGRLFDEIAGSYDEGHRRTVPCFEEFYGAVLDLFPAGRGSFRVLDLGSGTGILSAMVGKAFPEAEITLADFSNEMMNVAKDRLSDEQDGRFAFHLMDYVNEPLPGKYEVVVSALSLHHVEDRDKRKVFQKAYDSLEEGGVFINADQIPAGSTETNAAHDAKHRHHGAHQTHHEAADGGDASTASHHHMETHESSLEEQLAWIRGAGFTAVECTYENGRFVVCAGRRAVA